MSTTASSFTSRFSSGGNGLGPVCVFCVSVCVCLLLQAEHIVLCVVQGWYILSELTKNPTRYRQNENAPALTHLPLPASNSNHARQICLCNLDLVILTFDLKLGWILDVWPWPRDLWPLTLWPWPLTSFSDTRLKIRILRFLTLWPWPLTYDLDLRTHLSPIEDESAYKISGP